MEKFLEHKIYMDEYITGNRFIDICDSLGATFCKTDYLPSYKGEEHKVFITHNSDYHINEKMIRLWSPKTKIWLAQNKDFDIPILSGIPIGLENVRLRMSQAAKQGLYSSEVPGALSKAHLIDRISSLCIEKSSDVYMNFNIQTYPQERQHVWNMFVNKQWVTSTNDVSMEKFYFDLASHKFVISPRGNGVDCHRTWEALYLRTIPIVKNSLHMNSFSDLPIYYVNDWNEIDYNKLAIFYDKVENELYDLSKMKISYWKKKIGKEIEDQ